jgi:DNA-binding NarL/FixJ family response regulator
VLLANDRDSVQSLREALAQGCSVLPDDAPIASIAAAVHAAAAGLVSSSRALLVASLRRGPGATPSTEPLEPLTPREHEVLRHLSQGLGNKAIGESLNISPHTAKFHVGQIIAKLDAGSRAGAVAKAVRAGLVDI